MISTAQWMLWDMLQACGPLPTCHQEKPMNEQFNLEEEAFEIDPELDESSEFGEEYEDTEFDPESDAYSELGEGAFDGEFVEETQQRGSTAQRKIQQLRVAHAKLSKAVGAMGKHVTQRNGALRLALKARNAQDAAAKLRINPRLFVLLHNSMKRRNAQLRARGQGKAELELEASSSPCPGRTEVSPSWWGIRIYLNECHTKALIDAISAGSGAAGICAAVAPAPQVRLVCGVLGGLGGIGAAVISRIDSLGGNRGIVISKVYVPFTPPVVWHQ